MPQTIGAILAIGIGSITIGSVLANVAIGLALNYLAGMLAKKPPQSGATIDSGLNVTNIDPNAAFPFIFGRTRFAGVRRFHELSDNNQWFHFVNIYAAHEVDGYEEIIVNGNIVNVDVDGWASGTYAGKLRIKTYTGTPDQVADPYLLAHAPSYTEEMRGRGLAYAAVSVKWDTDLFPQEPTVHLVMRGAKVYDPREESHDLQDPSTWEWSRNAVLCQAHYMRGMPKVDANGDLRRLFGTNAKDSAIDWNSIAPEATIADEPIAMAEGGTQPQYTCDGILMADTEPEAGLNSLLTASAGMRLDTGGTLSLLAGAARTPEMHFDLSDLMGPLQVNLKRPMAQLYNAVKGQYRGAESDYQPDDAPVYRDEALVTLDGAERWLDVTLPFTDNAATAQRIQRQALSENRRQISVVFPFKLRAMRLKAGDWFTFSAASRGWAAKSFRVKRWKFKPIEGEDGVTSFSVEVEAEEIDAGVWTWTSADQVIVLPPANVNLPNPLIAPSPTMNAPELIEFRDRALYRLSATPAVDGPPVKYRFEHRPKGASVWTVLADRDEPSCLVYFEIGNYQTRVKAIVQPYGGQSAYVPNSVGLEFTVGVPPLTPRVTGLELVGGGGNGTFTGRDAVFHWNEGRVGAIGFDNPLGADVDQQDIYFAGYQMEVRTKPSEDSPNGRILRRQVITDTRFEYTFDMNYSDSLRIGLKSAQRGFRLIVKQLGRYAAGFEYSLPVSIDVENPAPAIPVDLNIRTLFKELRVSFTSPSDPDFEGGIIWASTTDGFDPAAVTPLFVGRGNLLTFELAALGTWFVRMAAFDAFIGTYDASDVALLNISPQVSVESAAIEIDAPDFTFDGIAITPKAGGDGVEWLAGSITVADGDGIVTTYSIGAGDAAWVSGTLFVFYEIGNTALSVTASIAAATGGDKRVIAIYKGGATLAANVAQVTLDAARLTGQITGTQISDDAITTPKLAAGAVVAGKIAAGAVETAALAADAVVASKIAAGEIGASHLVTGSAVITGAAQIASAIIGDGHIDSLTAGILEADSVFTQRLYVGEDELVEVNGDSGSQRFVFYEDL